MAEPNVCYLAPGAKQIEEEDLKNRVSQVNGQLIYNSAIRDEPPKGTEIYISKIPPDLTIQELLPVTQKCGTVYELRLMKDFSGKNRGFAYVRYTDIESAKRALDFLSGYSISPSCHLRASWSLDNCRLFIGQIRKDLTKESIFALLNRETEGLKDIILYLSSSDKTMNRGFFFAEYNNHREAAMARRKLINLDKISSWCPPDAILKVDWAIPEDSVDGEIMAKVKVLYVRNMMLRTTEHSLREVICHVVPPHEIVRVCKLQDFAFVHFKERSVAEKVMSFLQGFNLDGALLDVAWAKPPKPERKKNDNKKGHRNLRAEILALQKSIVPESSSPPLQENFSAVRLVNQPSIPTQFNNVSYCPTILTKDAISSGIGSINRSIIGHSDGIPSGSPTPCTIKPAFIWEVFGQFMASHPPSMALKNVFQYFHWGTIDFKIIEIVSEGNKFIYYCHIYNGDIAFTTAIPGKTPDEAMNNAALAFIKNNFCNFTYHVRLPSMA